MDSAPQIPEAPRRVEVHWLDAQSRPGWKNREEWNEDLADWPWQLQLSVGYVIEDNADGIALAHTCGHEGMYADVIWIPRQIVHKVTSLSALVSGGVEVRGDIPVPPGFGAGHIHDFRDDGRCSYPGCQAVSGATVSRKLGEATTRGVER